MTYHRKHTYGKLLCSCCVGWVRHGGRFPKLSNRVSALARRSGGSRIDHILDDIGAQRHTHMLCRRSFAWFCKARITPFTDGLLLGGGGDGGGGFGRVVDGGGGRQGVVVFAAAFVVLDTAGFVVFVGAGLQGATDEGLQTPGIVGYVRFASTWHMAPAIHGFLHSMSSHRPRS